ncbi:alpha-ketoglutarate-dependent dioxygenase AlkB family protein [Atopomonas sediminilitoris]|uniref:alpha-ketoglutarate-dependent dioxygenase AlkB family protein n=1 Tax=Atopomonas sediminilitoris TaxID=2919919 RepID=UPI001F4DB640|nr:alpha-ketoglutarate-dependent dioxygenase AlkB [Atopomonas sediminilitoris]MCJ8170884.1 alpha-ketoglutarate-dependent dioxygenase AlkB [Atopomonas sediminilitoris]
MRSESLNPGRLTWYDHWCTPAQADVWFEQLKQQCAWQQPTLRLFGREHLTPRQVAWYGDRGVRYRYSGYTHHAQPWMPVLAALRAQVEQTTGRAFNAVLLNYYRDGMDCMGWHSDDEPELGPDPWVASLSLGAARRFDLRRKGSTRIGLSYTLSHGQLLLMDGHCQHHWQHQLPRTRKVQAGRINLTFRHVINSEL